MLTKEERNAIAESENECAAVCGSLYEVLLGHRSACNTTYEEDMKKLLARIIDLCDTSNMVELPVDKDGKIIKVGDMVYNGNMDKCRVTGIEYMAVNSVCIRCFETSTLDSITYLPNQLTHMPVSETEQLAKAIKNAVDTFNEQLRDFAEYIASVGGNDD